MQCLWNFIIIDWGLLNEDLTSTHAKYPYHWFSRECGLNHPAILFRVDLPIRKSWVMGTQANIRT